MGKLPVPTAHCKNIAVQGCCCHDLCTHLHLPCFDQLDEPETQTRSKRRLPSTHRCQLPSLPGAELVPIISTMLCMMWGMFSLRACWQQQQAGSLSVLQHTAHCALLLLRTHVHQLIPCTALPALAFPFGGQPDCHKAHVLGAAMRTHHV